MESGFENVVDQRAGFLGERDLAGRVLSKGWREEGLPVDEGAGGEQSYEGLRKG